MENTCEVKLRTRSEIDKDYAQLAINYGDSLFKQELLHKHIKSLHDKMVALSEEQAAPAVESNPEPASE